MVGTESSLRTRTRVEGLEEDSFFRSVRSALISLLFLGYRGIISPFLHALGAGFGCRYSETCSVYSERILKEKGFWKGSPLMLKRILSCNPWMKSQEMERS